jgi:YVTN family beta-propeller protein
MLGGMTTPAVFLVLLTALGVGGAPPAVRPIRTIPLPGVSGRIDHMAVDPSGNRLFVAALGNNSVEVIDLGTGTRTRSLTGLPEPQGIIFASGANRLFVACGGDGTLRIFDGATLEPVSRVPLGSDADNVRYDPARGRVYVGYGSGGLAVMDERGRRLGNVELPDHPESFALEDGGERIFVNVPGAECVEVVDGSANTVKASWPLGGAKGNFPMALDRADSVLYVGCRRPPEVLGLNARTGRIVTGLPVGGDPDDLYVDASRRRVIVSCGSGELDVLAIGSSGTLEPLSRIPTAPGARTSLFLPESGRIILAVPRRDGHDAEIRVVPIPDSPGSD